MPQVSTTCRREVQPEIAQLSLPRTSPAIDMRRTFPHRIFIQWANPFLTAVIPVWAVRI